MVWFVKKKLAAGLLNTQDSGQALINEDFTSSEPVAKISEPPPIREAPLFIKVDRYKEMLSYFGALKNDIETLKQLGNVLNSTQEMFMATNNAISATLEKTNKIIDSLDAEMGRPQGLNIDMDIEAKRAEMKVSLNELKSQLDKLKNEVKAISA